MELGGSSPPPVTTLSQINPVHGSNPTSLRSILILSSYLSLDPPSGLIPSGFPTKSLYAPLLSPILTTCSTHLILFDLITRKISDEEYKSLGFSLFNFLRSFLSRSSGPNILLSNPVLKHLKPTFLPQCQRPSFTPIQTKDKIIVLFILIFIFLANHWICMFLASQLEDNMFRTKWWQAFPDFNRRLISSWIEFLFVRVFPKYLKCSTSSKELLSGFILWFRPAILLRDMAMCVVLSAFTSSPVSWLETTRDSVFFFIVCTLQRKIWPSSA
jgi:hypothetical protein